MIFEALAFNTSLFTLHEKFDSLGRNAGYALSNEVALITGTMQSFDQYGRLNQVTVDGITNAFTYGYLEGSHLQKTLAMPNGVTRTYGYEVNRDLLTMIVHSNATELLVQRDFTYDGLSRLANRTLFRANEASVALDAFAYNSRFELTNAIYQITQLGNNAIRQFSYDFDPIGNRNSATEFGTNIVYVARKGRGVVIRHRTKKVLRREPDFDTFRPCQGNSDMMWKAGGIISPRAGCSVRRFSRTTATGSIS